MPKSFKKFILKSFPGENFPTDLSCFELVHSPFIELPDQFVRIKIKCVSIDPVLRVWISGAKSYLPAIKLNEQIPAFSVGVVLESKSKKYTEGTHVVGRFWWSEQCIVKQDHYMFKIPEMEEENVFRFLTFYGPTGLTAFLSIKEQILPFDRNISIVISSAAGGVGVALILFLVHYGFKNIIGIVGSDFKCRKIEQLGCKRTINYKTESIEKKLKILCPDGVDLFYDNVGEEILEQILPCMRLRSKIILCGATATYNQWKSKKGIKNVEMLIFKQIKMKGILYYYSSEKLKEALMQLFQLQLKFHDTIIDGIEKCPQTYQELYKGMFIGKPLIRF